MKENCLFCKMVKREIGTDIVYEDNIMLAFRDIAPQAPVHVLFIPKKHIETISELSRDDAGLVAEMMLKIAGVARSEGISRSGYRVVANCNKDAGQEVFHIHFHLLGGRPLAWPPG